MRAPIGAFPFGLERLGVVMSPLAGEPAEAWGVLNPATARRGADLYLFPRLVAEGNYSRIGRARVIFDEAGIPVDVERLGIVLEPHEAVGAARGWRRGRGPADHLPAAARAAGS